MLEIQKFMRAGHSFEELYNQYEISAKAGGPMNRWVIFNYSHTNKPHKYKQIVRECRGRVLDATDWSVVAIGFPRFYNYGEHENTEQKFNWDDFVCEEKVDGSLMLLHTRNDAWVVNTRNSFADASVSAECQDTWSALFWEAFFGPQLCPAWGLRKLSELNKNYTYIFEMGTPYTTVVHQWDAPTIKLLGAVSKEWPHQELSTEALDALGFERPRRYDIQNAEAMTAFLAKPEIGLFEGFVCKDNLNNRFKIKNLRYVAASYLKQNGNVFLEKNVLPLVFNENDADEVCTYWPEVRERITTLRKRLFCKLDEVNRTYSRIENIRSQKEFALQATKTPYSSLLFQARRFQKSVYDVCDEKTAAKLLGLE